MNDFETSRDADLPSRLRGSSPQEATSKVVGPASPATINEERVWSPGDSPVLPDIDAPALTVGKDET